MLIKIPGDRSGSGSTPKWNGFLPGTYCILPPGRVFINPGVFVYSCLEINKKGKQTGVKPSMFTMQEPEFGGCLFVKISFGERRVCCNPEKKYLISATNWETEKGGSLLFRRFPAVFLKIQLLLLCLYLHQCTSNQVLTSCTQLLLRQRFDKALHMVTVIYKIDK